MDYVRHNMEILGRGSVFLNPQVSGSGIKVKSMNALAARRVLVSTPNGIQGIPGMVGRDYLVGENTAALVDILLRVLREPEFASEIAANGYCLARREFSKEAFLRRSSALLCHSLPKKSSFREERVPK